MDINGAFAHLGPSGRVSTMHCSHYSPRYGMVQYGIGVFSASTTPVMRRDVLRLAVDEEVGVGVGVGTGVGVSHASLPFQAPWKLQVLLSVGMTS